MDVDVLFLRDFGPLLSAPFDFAYQWSMHDFFNTAILGLTKGSPVALAMVEHAMKTGSPKG